MKRLVSAFYDEFHPFNHLWPEAAQLATREADDLREGDILIVHGGQDISPSLYGRRMSKETHASIKPGFRDVIEWAMMCRAKELKIPIIGICRGAQMLCALAGGHLIQHVRGHSGSHVVVTKDGSEFTTNSIHHQMQYPFNVEHDLVAWSAEKLSDVYVDEDTTVDVVVEPEYVYYPSVKGYAVQWHPEMMREDCAATKFLFNHMVSTL